MMEQENEISLSENYSPNKDQTNIELSEQELSELTESEAHEINLENLDSLIIGKKPKIFENEKEYIFTKNQERADVYIKNYLMKFDMNKTLKMMEQEFFEKLSKGEIDIDMIPNVPNAYIQSEGFQEKIGNIQKELDDAKIYAEKANSLFMKLQRAKENEKIRHRRVQQEKQKLIKEIDKMQKVYKEDEGIYKELEKKYWLVTKESLFLEQDLKGLTSKVENLKDTHEKLKKTLDEAKRQKDRI
jgi:hypothetical protein